MGSLVVVVDVSTEIGVCGDSVGLYDGFVVGFIVGTGDTVGSNDGRTNGVSHVSSGDDGSHCAPLLSI